MGPLTSDVRSTCLLLALLRPRVRRMPPVTSAYFGLSDPLDSIRGAGWVRLGGAPLLGRPYKYPAYPSWHHRLTIARCTDFLERFFCHTLYSDPFPKKKKMVCSCCFKAPKHGSFNSASPEFNPTHQRCRALKKFLPCSIRFS